MRKIGRAVLVVLLILPVSANSQDPATDVTVHREWQDIQTNEDKTEMRNWWRRLNAGRLSHYVDAGADVNVADQHGWTPLHSAARDNSDPEVLLALLQAGADVDARNKSGDTPLHWAAAENRSVEILNALIDAGAEVNARDRFGWLPIHTAAESNPNPEIIKALLRAGSERKQRAYFVLFRPRFLAKHNSNLSKTDKKAVLDLLNEAERDSGQVTRLNDRR